MRAHGPLWDGEGLKWTCQDEKGSHVCAQVHACVGDGVTLSSSLVHQSLHYGRRGDLNPGPWCLN